MDGVRQARADDHDAVADFTERTWSDRDVRDYIPDVFSEWVASDGPDQRTVVATVDDEPVGLCQALLLNDDEAWLQGMRVHPDHRGADHGEAMVTALRSWCRERGATVARNLVFGWNGAGMGQSRAAGFDPVTACRWVRLPPDESATPDATVVDDPATAWRFWTHSDARDALSGLARATDEAWAVSELDRSRLETLAVDGRAFALVDDGTRAMTARAGTRERDGEVVAEYVVGAWADTAAAVELMTAIQADTGTCGADAARVLVPDTPRFVSDAATTRCELGDTTDYVFAADLTGHKG
ncbi:MAG: GNAT family N-acetyltransferase [Haloarculaceae archaeon]